MAKTKVNEKMATEFLSLRQKGRSFRSIGKEFGKDWRTVKAHIPKAQVEYEKAHWEAVSRQVDATYLDEHYRLLVRVAAALLDTVQKKPLDVHHKLDANLLIDNSVSSALQRATDLLQRKGIDTGSTEGDTMDHAVRERLARHLLDALMEHEPQVKRGLDKWKGCWSTFQQKRLVLVEQAKGLFKHKKVDDAVAEALKLTVVDEALSARLSGQEPRSSLVINVSGEEAVLCRRNQRSEQDAYRGPKE